MGEAKRSEEAVERKTTPYFEKVMRDNAIQCVNAAVSSMGILSNTGDDRWKALMVVRSVAAMFAAAHLPPDDHRAFFTIVGDLTSKALALDPGSQIIVPR